MKKYLAALAFLAIPAVCFGAEEAVPTVAGNAEAIKVVQDAS